MYSEHATAIGHAMREDVEIFKRGCVFVILTIRQRIDRVGEQMEEVDQKRTSAECLFGWKRAAYSHIQLHGRSLWEHLHWYREQGDDGRAAIRKLVEVPGLGIVKAAFAAQLFGFDVACIDSRNAEREGRRRDAFRYTKGVITERRFEKMLARYLSVTRGRAEEYWDAWCEYVAADYGRTADDISGMHLAILPDDYIPF